MAGLITDNVHGKAQITDVRPDRIRTCLARGEVPIVAGFQGRTKKGKRVTTLGRGGSDLTAVALAAALGAGICEIYTDVDGVYTADPGLSRGLARSDVLSSEVMLEFAASGCKVLHLRCVEYARRFGIPIHVRSSFVPAPGTLILPGLDRHPIPQAREGATRRDRRGRSQFGRESHCHRGSGQTGQHGAHVPGAVAFRGERPDNRPERGKFRVQAIRRCPDNAGPAGSPALAVLGAAQGTIGFEGLQHAVKSAGCQSPGWACGPRRTSSAPS